MTTAEEVREIQLAWRKVRQAEKKSVEKWIDARVKALEARMLKAGEEKHVCDRSRRKEIVDYHINDETIRDSNKPVDYSFHNLKDLIPIGCEQAGGTRLGEPPERDPINKKFLTKALWLNNNNLESIAGLDVFAENIIDRSPQLTFIDLSYNRIKHIDIVIQQFPNLTVLYLHGNRIKEKCNMMRLTPLTKLRNVTFEGNPICACELYRDLALVCMPSIVHLDHKPVTKTDRSHPVHPEIVRFLKHCANRGYAANESKLPYEKPPIEPKKQPEVPKSAPGKQYEAPKSVSKQPAAPKSAAKAKAKGSQKSQKGAPSIAETKRGTEKASPEGAKVDGVVEDTTKEISKPLTKGVLPRKANGLGDDEEPTDYTQYPQDIVEKANELFKAAIEVGQAALVDGSGDQRNEAIVVMRNVDDGIQEDAVDQTVDPSEYATKRRTHCMCCDCRKQRQQQQ